MRTALDCAGVLVGPTEPFIDTRREADDEAERQMWNTATLRLSLPDRVEELLRDALHAGRSHFGLRGARGQACLVSRRRDQQANTAQVAP